MTGWGTRPHRRLNPLTDEWVLVSPQRALRPWLGASEAVPASPEPAYDPDCTLCPGNTRASGVVNPRYSGPFVFDNDFPALLPQADLASRENGPLFRSAPEAGRCRVVCFSPRHDRSLPELELAEIAAVLLAWREETGRLLAEPGLGYVQVFENKGAAMGCSNPHPHCQVWATEHVPNEVVKELRTQRAYRREHGGSLLADYLDEEQNRGARLVCFNAAFSALVPFWATWPFETLVLPHRRVSSLLALTAHEIMALADLLQRLTTRYDNLFRCSFPYTLGVHQAPAAHLDGDEMQLHLHVYPPLLRDARVRKFMVGFELLGMPQRDLTPEQAAERLRTQSEHHYTRRPPALSPGEIRREH